MLLRTLGRLVPAIGLVVNRWRFPGLKVGLGVGVEGGAGFSYGAGVSFGDGTRIENSAGMIKIGDGASFSRHVHLVSLPGGLLQVGARSVIQDHCRIYGDVRIGRQCVFAPNIFISSGTHTFDVWPSIPVRVQEQLVADDQRPVRIGDDCWLGVNVVVGRDVTIGRGCVIGANSVVTHDVPPYSVAAGNPAKVLRPRLAFVPKPIIDASSDDDIPYFYEGFEFQIQPRDHLSAPDGRFVLVMSTARGTRIRLRIAGGRQIRFGQQAADAPQEPGLIEFVVPDTNEECFLVFETDGPCRVYAADIL